MLDLAVGIVIGVAFGAVIRSLVENLVTPVLAIGGEIDFRELAIEVGGGRIRYGAFVNDLLAFLVVALSVYFLVVRPVNAWQRRRAEAAPATETTTCPHCLSTIPAAATRCAFCTGEQPAGAPAEVGHVAEVTADVRDVRPGA